MSNSRGLNVPIRIRTTIISANGQRLDGWMGE